MCSHLKLVALLLVVVVLGVNTAEAADCDDYDARYSLPCNPGLDPWQAKKNTFDALTKSVVVDVQQPYSLWQRIYNGNENVMNLVEVPEKPGEKTKREVKNKAEELAKRDLANIAKKAAGARELLKKGIQLLGAIAGAVEFLGNIMEIVSMFMPEEKSAELKAIESGFAKMDARLLEISSQLANIKDAMEWNSILGKLVGFGANVDQTTDMYKKIVEELKSEDRSHPLSLTVKGHIEDLIEYIKGTGNIGSMLKLIDNLFKGNAGFVASGKPLLEIFVDAVDNDCSKILPMSNKLIGYVRNAQRVQFFYELTQELVTPDDDKGYPRMLHDMYTESITQYRKCTRNAVSYAKQNMEVWHGNDEILIDIIDKLEPKYEFYNWATMKENKKEDDHFALIDNSAGKRLNVELTKLSDDDKKEQRLSLFVTMKSSNSEVDDAIARIENVLKQLKKEDLPELPIWLGWSRSQKMRDDLLKTVCNLFKGDDTLKSLIDKRRMTMVMFKDDSSIDLDGWHFKSNMKVMEPVSEMIHGQGKAFGKESIKEILGFTLGFLFNFADDMRGFRCIYGDRISMSFEGSFPYCLCHFNYGGDSCDISLKTAPVSTISNAMLDLVQLYKVPGMFDLQDAIRNGADKVMQEIEGSKQQIFTEARQTRRETVESKNAILSAQSIMLNDLKADNAELLKEFSGLAAAMEFAFEKERNDRIYETEKGQKEIIKAIDAASNEVCDSINKLSGQIAQNRYYEYLRYHIPAFMKQFKTIELPGDYSKNSFIKYILDTNQHAFDVAKTAVKEAIVENSDSFLAAEMEINMISGCTDIYTKRIEATWSELVQLNLQMNMMLEWALAYEISKTTNKGRIAVLKYHIGELMKTAATDLEDIEEVRSRSCLPFSMPDLLGGGCEAYITYPGQSVQMQCSDPNKSLVLASSTSDVIHKVTCNSDSDWDVDVTELRCVSKCVYNKQYYEIGITRILPAAPTGYDWVDKSGNAVMQYTCLALPVPDPVILRDRLSDEVIPVSVEQSRTYGNNEENYGAARAIDLDWQTRSVATTDGGSTWLKLSLDHVYCIREVVQYNRDGSPEHTWTWSDAKCSCDGNSYSSHCPDYALTVSIEGLAPVTLPRHSHCRYGDSVKLQKITNRFFYVWEMAIFIEQGVTDRLYRLVNDTGGDVLAGDRGLLLYKGGTLCDDEFSINFANTICERMGYTRAAWTSGYYYGDYQQQFDITPFNIKRRGRKCNHKQDVFLTCTGDQERLRGSWSTVTKSDINECATSELCGYGGSCTNTVGSFTCTCLSGFSVGPDRKCQDVNECNSGMVGYNKCLVQNILGACENTVGSYTCRCFSGAFTKPNLLGRECIDCNCNKNGVTSSVCDGQTGDCLCKTNVGGKTCDNCKTGYTPFPYCNKCAPWYHGQSCEIKCDCDKHGVTALVCNAMGKCDCMSHVDGKRCDKCSKNYKDFPTCKPDVINGELSEWGPWTDWSSDDDYCGDADKKGYDQTRTRKRTCNDTPRNIHGSSCANEKLTETAQPRFWMVCKKIDWVYIKLSESGWAPTTANLYMQLKQRHALNDVKCYTKDPTWSAPAYENVKYWREATGCDTTFDSTKDIEIWLYHSNSNDVYVTEMGLSMAGNNGPIKAWKGGVVQIDSGANNGWYTATTIT